MLRKYKISVYICVNITIDIAARWYTEKVDMLNRIKYQAIG
jgi:hypothetical protein